jgi:hypothetical protein
MNFVEATLYRTSFLGAYVVLNSLSGPPFPSNSSLNEKTSLAKSLPSRTITGMPRLRD